jgi:hypothetical protein
VPERRRGIIVSGGRRGNEATRLRPKSGTGMGTPSSRIQRRRGIIRGFTGKGLTEQEEKAEKQEKHVKLRGRAQRKRAQSTNHKSKGRKGSREKRNSWRQNGRKMADKAIPKNGQFSTNAIKASGKMPTRVCSNLRSCHPEYCTLQ